jgi:hypothetical protein
MTGKKRARSSWIMKRVLKESMMFSVVANGSDCRVSMGVRAEFELNDWWPAHRMVVVGIWNVGFGRKD